MARYLKVTPLVAKDLNLENDRNRLKDGNYLLWQNDILPYGRLIDLSEILAKIGGLALAPYEARQEQDGTVIRELPVATDPRFVVAKPTEAETTTEDEKTEDAEEQTENAEEQTENVEDDVADTTNENEEKEG